METNHDHELPLLQGQANGASNNTNATNKSNSVGEDGLIESELGSEIDHVIGAVVDSEEKKKEKQREHTKQHDRKRKQENITASTGLCILILIPTKSTKPMTVDPSTHYGRLFNQEYHDNIDFQNVFFPTVIGCLDKIPLINADNITQLPGNNDVPSYVISSGLYLVLG
ncbi:hypothetical protein SEMRO_2307_G322770.1 [Seminavis robusta]|uniref:Uncharacterized protein n=1 Tax=Seminavis robusta TaxID=568900 RepID=A0A9N8HVD9_9STRA|nr:hypothetical protein SEMRO_2307_G322770.1 [Seminavis robusta]|eukprot:Sro2307_g322770.1 n/a (169) ;mRNA; f:6855-7361